MPKRVLILCASLIAFTTPSRLLAQPLSAEGRETGAYRNAIDSALAEFELGNYAEAREHFRVAHGLDPSARTLRGLGIAEFELRNYPDSVLLLEQALASEIKPLTADMRTQVENVLRRARGYVGEISIHHTPSSAEVAINGQPANMSDAAVLLPVGDHVLEFTATGYVTQRRSISVKGGAKLSIHVDLVALTTEEVDHSSAKRERSNLLQPLYARWWLWTTIGLVAAGTATTAVLVRRARNSADLEPRLSANVPDEVRGGLPVPAAR